MVKNKQSAKKKSVAAVILVVIAVAILFITIRFVHRRMVYAVTDAVFVRTDSLVNVGFDRVSGRLQSLAGKAGDPVTRGEALAAIDDTAYRLTVEELEASLEAARNECQEKVVFLERLKKETGLKEEIADSKVAELRRQKDALSDQLSEVEVEITQLRRDNDRYEKLLRSKAVSHSQAEDRTTKFRARRLAKQAMKKQIAALEASIVTALRQVDLAKAERLRIRETEKNIGRLTEKIKETDASLQRARNDLDQCVIKSPVTGRIAKRYVSPGSQVTPQKVVFTLVDPNDLYIIALLEEQKLAGVVPGSPTHITIDAYPGKDYEGEVEAVLPASAATFAVAPRDISAGEFTKVSQRIPVRIRLTKGDKKLLRVGLGGEVEIKRQAKGQEPRRERS